MSNTNDLGDTINLMPIFLIVIPIAVFISWLLSFRKQDVVLNADYKEWKKRNKILYKG